ncbi:Hypothetical predicted protein [Octopus vulgaris]|uniref:Uncharacterized protein n=1 Tax=Octopus vulgaris TaxID=6645 RepID=A0AA36F6A8_OCTVU|nr:Hypothetical predicted protein [Octopus vulgaris]
MKLNDHYSCGSHDSDDGGTSSRCSGRKVRRIISSHIGSSISNNSDSSTQEVAHLTSGEVIPESVVKVMLVDNLSKPSA